jgi:hypothetical protein
VQAWKLGVVAEVGHLVTSEDSNTDELELIESNDLVQFFASQLRFLSSFDPVYITGQTVLDALVSAMYCNLTCTEEDRLTPLFLTILQAALGQGFYISSADEKPQTWTAEAQAALDEALLLLQRLDVPGSRIKRK